MKVSLVSENIVKFIYDRKMVDVEVAGIVKLLQFMLETTTKLLLIPCSGFPRR